MKRIPLLLVLVSLFLTSTAQKPMQGRQFLKDKCLPHYMAPLYKDKEKLFPILPVDHAYYVFGSREYKRVQKSVPLFAVFPTAYLFAMEPMAETAVRKLSLFQLDVHTGQID